MIRALIAAIVLAVGPSAHAQESAAEGALAPLSFLHGCWLGAFAGSDNLQDERCFTPLYDGRYVRDVHALRGGQSFYGGETIFFRDAEAGRIAFIYFASDGGVQRGFAEEDAGGLRFPPSVYIGADGRAIHLRGSWRPDGPDRFLAVSEIEEDGRWREHLRIDFRRVPAP